MLIWGPLLSCFLSSVGEKIRATNYWTNLRVFLTSPATLGCSNILWLMHEKICAGRGILLSFKTGLYRWTQNLTHALQITRDTSRCYTRNFTQAILFCMIWQLMIFLTLFRLPMWHIFNMATVAKYNPWGKKSGGKTVGTERHRVADWIPGK